MTLQNSGPISLSDIAAEFTDAAPHALSEFYAATPDIPASGGISFSQFLGVSAAFRYTISENTQELNLRAALVTAGWDEETPVEVTINPEVYVWSDDTAVPALDMGGTFPGGLTIVNKGYIMGRGGDGGYQERVAVWTIDPPIPAGDGGPAMRLSGPVEIDNSQGYIGGGGGGGAGPAGVTIAFRYPQGSNFTVAGGGGAGGGLGAPGIYTEGANRYHLLDPSPGPPPGEPGRVTSREDNRVITSSAYYLVPASPNPAGGAGGGSSYYVYKK